MSASPDAGAAEVIVLSSSSEHNDARDELVIDEHVWDSWDEDNNPQEDGILVMREDDYDAALGEPPAAPGGSPLQPGNSSSSVSSFHDMSDGLLVGGREASEDEGSSSSSSSSYRSAGARAKSRERSPSEPPSRGPLPRSGALHLATASSHVRSTKELYDKEISSLCSYFGLKVSSRAQNLRILEQIDALWAARGLDIRVRDMLREVPGVERTARSQSAAASQPERASGSARPAVSSRASRCSGTTAVRPLNEQTMQAINNAIISNTSLYERILLLKSIDFPTLALYLKEMGIHVSKRTLEMYLYAQGIGFAYTSERR